MNREGIAVARCTVARLMKLRGLRGAVRGKRASHDEFRYERTAPAGPGQPAVQG